AARDARRGAAWPSVVPAIFLAVDRASASPEGETSSEFRAEQALGRGGEDFQPVLGHADRVFALRRQRFIAGHGGPAVRQHLHRGLAQVHHRLDREEHARLQHRALAATAVVQNVGAVVKDPADAVAAEVAHHAHALGLDELLDGVADVAEGVPRLDLGQTQVQRLIGDVDQPLGAGVDLADRIHAARIAMPAVDDDGVVDVDDVAFLQDLVAGNAVADDVVDRGADRLGIALVAQAGGRAAVVQGELAHQIVQLARGHARLHMLADHVQRLGDQAAGLAHALEPFRVIYADFVAADEDVGFQVGGLVHAWLSGRRAPQSGGPGEETAFRTSDGQTSTKPQARQGSPLTQGPWFPI